MIWTQFNIGKYDFLTKHSEFISNLPKMEQTLIGLFMRNEKQKDIGKILGITQGAVSSRLGRAITRLKYLRELSAINFNQFFKDMDKISSPLEMEIIKGLVETSCQTETAWRINARYNLKGLKKMNQVKVRHRLEIILKNLKEVGNHIRVYKRHSVTLDKVMKSLYILHEVKLPHFDRVRT